jgi:hypothetical protein
MNKISKNLLILFLAFLFGSCFGIYSVQAQNNKLILETTKECHIQYSGESCIADLKLINNTGEILDGEAFLHIDYQGVCGDGFFDGKGIDARFFLSSNWLNFSNWNAGTATVSGFDIIKGETQSKLKIETAPNLCPGKYVFNLELKGTTEIEETYTAGTVIIVGGGGYIPPTTPDTDTGRVIATPGEGGRTTLTDSDGNKIKLTIPPGAISGNTVFTIKQVDIGSIDQPGTGSGLFLINGLVYEIKARNGAELITGFDKPLTLTFTYTDEQVEELAETSLKIYWRDKDQNQWIAIENSEVNINNNTVSASIDHLTLFALMGSNAEFLEKKAEIEKEKEKSISEKIGVSEIIKEIPKRIIEEIKEITERVISSAPTEEAEKPLDLEEITQPEKTTPPQTEEPQRGLALMMAAASMTLGEISKSALLAIVVILCLIGLAFVGIKEWKLFYKKRNR